MKPNIILTILDTVRAQDISCYGYSRPTTPWLDRVANEGTLFPNAITPAPWTIPAHASLFTSLYPSQHKVNQMGDRLSGSYVTLAEALKAIGYTTLGVSGNAFVGPQYGFDRGFDQFCMGWTLFQREASSVIKQTLNKVYAKFLTNYYDKGAWLVTRVVTRWLRQRKSHEQPFFLFANYLDAHGPYQPPPGYRQLFLNGTPWRKTRNINQNAWRYVSRMAPMTAGDFEILTALYDAQIRYVDEQIGRVYRALQGNSLLDNTLWIITSDHGENIGEHGLMGHQYCLYDTVLRVPLIIRYPLAFQANTVVEEQVSLLDVLPTIIDLLDQNQFESDWMGCSLLQPSTRPPHALAEFLVPQPSIASLHAKYGYAPSTERFERQLRCIRTSRYKYIMASDGTQELYDLQIDATETTNRVERQPKVATQLRNLLYQQLGSLPAKLSGIDQEALEADPILEERLRALGYI
jgi:arylsulfatase A-like enzyme